MICNRETRKAVRVWANVDTREAIVLCIFASHESTARRGAHGMGEIVLKNDSFCGKSVYVWSRNVATIVGNIMPAKIISEHKHDMRLCCMRVFPENWRYGNPQKDHKKNESAR